MNKIVLRKTTNAIFLAIVLVVGTITLIYPSFIVGVQAESDDDDESDNNDNKLIRTEDKDESSEDEAKDDDDDSDEEDNNSNENSNNEIKEVSYDSDNNSYYKSKDSSSVFVKKVKCNNINVNVNGLDFNVAAPTNGVINGPIDEAQEAEDEGQIITANAFGDVESYGNGDSSSDRDFKFVCINNNNNVVIGNETTPEPQEPLTCEECFTENLTPDQVDAIEFFLNEFTTIEGLEGFCDDFLTDPNNSNERKISNVGILLSFAEVFDEDTRLAVLECLEELGLITVGSGGDHPDR